VSTPVAWSELGGLKSSARFTLANLGRRLSGLAEDPWHDMTRMRQALPDVDALRPN
jgi:DNA primase